MKKVILYAFALIVTVIVVKTLTFGQKSQEDVKQVTVTLDEKTAVSNIAKSITFKTISYQDKIVAAPFDAFYAFLQQTYPLTFSQLEVTKISNLAFILKWQGSDANLLPALMLAHQDVVPVEPGSIDKWRFAPFSGTVQDGFIWGRGALDDKASLISSLEAVELLLSQDHQPKRSYYFAFGHDEEVGGRLGAVKMAEHFESQNLKFEYIIDEGGLITKGMIPGITKPVALIGPAEKGFVTLELKVNSGGGHSSTPPKQTAIGQLANAIAKIDAFDFESDLSGTITMAEELADELPLVQKVIFANTWLLSPLLEYVLTQRPELAAGIRTTIAPTVFNAGIKENILPTEASALVNFRILPGHTIASTISTIKDVIDDNDISVNERPGGFGSEPSAVASTQSAPYLAMKKSIQQIIGKENIAIAPRIVVGATDTRHFSHLTQNTLHFVGVDLTKEQLTGFHGINERVSVEGYLNAIKIYYQMIKNTDS